MSVHEWIKSNDAAELLDESRSLHGPQTTDVHRDNQYLVSVDSASTNIDTHAHEEGAIDAFRHITGFRCLNDRVNASLEAAIGFKQSPFLGTFRTGVMFDCPVTRKWDVVCGILGDELTEESKALVAETLTAQVLELEGCPPLQHMFSFGMELYVASETAWSLAALLDGGRENARGLPESVLSIMDRYKKAISTAVAKMLRPVASKLLPFNEATTRQPDDVQDRGIDARVIKDLVRAYDESCQDTFQKTGVLMPYWKFILKDLREIEYQVQTPAMTLIAAFLADLHTEHQSIQDQFEIWIPGVKELSTWAHGFVESSRSAKRKADECRKTEHKKKQRRKYQNSEALTFLGEEIKALKLQSLKREARNQRRHNEMAKFLKQLQEKTEASVKKAKQQQREALEKSSTPIKELEDQRAQLNRFMDILDAEEGQSGLVDEESAVNEWHESFKALL